MIYSNASPEHLQAALGQTKAPKMMFLTFVIYWLVAQLAHAHVSDDLVVRTKTGVFRGNLNDTYPDVRQFKWIPYAKVLSASETLERFCG